MLISIGIQCTNATLKKKLHIDTKTLPFDWQISNPKFVFTILRLLLDYKDSITIEDIVEHHFFNCDKRAKRFPNTEHYFSCDDGEALLNSLYDVVFPHDTYSNETKEKYVRRLNRLRDYILSSNEKLIFVYSSQASVYSSNFRIDNQDIIKGVYYYLTRIYNLISKYNNNFEIVVFDSILDEDRNDLHQNIYLFKMKQCGSWMMMLDQILENQSITKFLCEKLDLCELTT